MDSVKTSKYLGQSNGKDAIRYQFIAGKLRTNVRYSKLSTDVSDNNENGKPGRTRGWWGDSVPLSEIANSLMIAQGYVMMTERLVFMSHL